MTECSSCGRLTSNGGDFCGSCGAYPRWDEPEPGEQPTAVLSDEAVTTVMAVEPPPAVAVAPERDPVRVSLMGPEDTGAGAEPPTVRVPAGGSSRLIGAGFNQSGCVDSSNLPIPEVD